MRFNIKILVKNKKFLDCIIVKIEANFRTIFPFAVEFLAPIKGTRNNTPLPVKHSLRWREDACVDTVKEK